MKIEETAINSADEALVTAMKTSSKVAAAPPEPSMATAALGRTRPAVTSASGIRLGYVGNVGEDSRAIQESPIVVAVSQGIANQERPPSTYPGKAIEC